MMSRPITFSLYNSKLDTRTQLVTKNWTDWIPILISHIVRGSPEDTNSEELLNQSKDGPAVILGPVRGPRAKNNVQELHALGLDIDDSPPQTIDTLLAKLAPYEYVVYTTHKHGSNVVSHPRIRILLPLSEPIQPQDYPAAWEALQRLVGGSIDPSTKDCSRIHFLPSTFDPSKALADHHSGRWISADDLLTPPDIFDDILEEDEKYRHISKIQRSLKGLHTTNPLSTAALALSKGEAFAEAPNRHATILKLTLYLARKFPKLPIESLKLVFSDSLRTMSSQPDPPSMREVIDAFKGAKVKLSQKANSSPRIKVYNSHNLEQIARRQYCKVSDLENRWIIQKDGGGWILDQTGNYRGYYTHHDFSIAIRKYLSGAPVELYELTEKGKKRLPNEELLNRYGDVAKNIISSLSAQYSTYDPITCTLTEAISPLRNLNPVFDPRIDAWLRLLFYANPEKGLDWLASCSDLTKQNCAIYFVGPKDSGKSIFAEGLAKLWTDGNPGSIELVLSEFNEEFVRCPLIFADETIPKKYARQEVTAKLRAMLSTTARSLRRLYHPPSTLKGAIRLLLAANNTSLLNTEEIHTPEDQAAIAQRFMYVKIGNQAAKYLSSIPRSITAGWIEHGIAEHALWLQENRQIANPGNRFVVEGDLAEMHRLLTVGSHWSSLLCEWLVRYLMNPAAIDSAAKGFILRRDGKLWVNNQVFVESWESYLGKSRERPDSRKIGHAVNTIAKSTSTRQIRFGPYRHRYKEIDIEHLIHWAREYNIGDEETLKEMIATPSGDSPADFEPEDRSDREPFDYN